MRVGLLLACMASLVLSTAQAKPPAPVPKEKPVVHAPVPTKQVAATSLAGSPTVLALYQLGRCPSLEAVTVTVASATPAPRAYALRGSYQSTVAAPGTAAPPEGVSQRRSKVPPDPGRPLSDTKTDTKDVKNGCFG